MIVLKTFHGLKSIWDEFWEGLGGFSMGFWERFGTDLEGFWEGLGGILGTSGSY